MYVYSLFDEKSQTYGTPFFQLADGQATRSLQELVKDSQSLVSKYPEDFILYNIAEFDEVTGLITPKPNPAEGFICRASALVPLPAQVTP